MSENIDLHEQQVNELKRAARKQFVEGLVPLAFVGLVVAGIWHSYKYRAREDEREVEAWIVQVKNFPDSWERFQAFAHGHESMTQEQRALINRLADATLRQALTEQKAAAFEYLQSSSTFRGPEWRDQYPRDPEQRRAQIDALRVLWPSITELTAGDRMDLVDMAARCHLHEAAPPVSRQTVLDCLRTGAHSLGTVSKLTRLMDFARLGEALTKNEDAK